ncbi:cupin domain-containing protein [uncultured Sphingomonas sp.]|uniref:cupin domain-containing protein n=1 Tax=uncultured Sphingomonas sp. TaxID=158754 RepID=UPI0025EC4391|nr:cupin domain-containing protein [uncultured Sphingomonas sp.]
MRRLMLESRGGIPNNPALAVRLYPAAVDGSDRGAAFEARFAANGWPPQWRDGVFDYHHYHSTAHEVLGCYAGRATLTIGGPGGETVEIAAGDALMLPAGTGHKCEEASDDFGVVGAYPAGQEWDVVTTPADVAIHARIAAVPVPERDPVTGEPF